MKDRITVQEAARRLGVKDDAIRKRIQRGSLEHDKDPNGRVFVYLDADHDSPSHTYKDTSRYPSQDEANGAAQATAYVELVEMLHSELEDWKRVVATRDEELRRKDHIIAALTERLPEIEPPQESSAETRDGSVMASEGTGKGEAGADAQNISERRSWLYRFFFG